MTFDISIKCSERAVRAMFPFFGIPAHATVVQGQYAVWTDEAGEHRVDVATEAKACIHAMVDSAELELSEGGQA